MRGLIDPQHEVLWPYQGKRQPSAAVEAAFHLRLASGLGPLRTATPEGLLFYISASFLMAVFISWQDSPGGQVAVLLLLVAGWALAFIIPDVLRALYWREYRDLYLRLATTSLSIVVADAAFWELELPTQDDLSPAALIPHGQPQQLVDCLERIARNPRRFLAQTATFHASSNTWLAESWSLPLRLDGVKNQRDLQVSARYAALYDYFFNPQVKLDQALARQVKA